MFETDKEVLDWYERQPRALSKEYVAGIKWNEIKNHPINPAFLPVLVYMRDIEYFTDMYYQELRRTPTGKDPIIRKFMDRWSIEELHHGNLLNRGYIDNLPADCCVEVPCVASEHGIEPQSVGALPRHLADRDGGRSVEAGRVGRHVCDLRILNWTNATAATMRNSTQAMAAA